MKNAEQPVKKFAKEVRTVDKDAKASSAFKMFKRRNTHLVVTDEDETVGIVSYKDLLWNMWDEAKEGKAANLYVSSIASRNLFTVKETMNIKKATKKMIEKNISSLPVERNGKIESILTKKYLLEKITEFPNEEIKNLMTRDVISANEGTGITKAIDTMKRNNISMLPIIEKGEIVGFVDIHGLAREMIAVFINPPYRHIDSALKRITLGDIMEGPLSLFPDQSIYEFGKKVVRKKVKGMPIVSPENPKKVKGILSETDVSRYISNLP